MAKGFNPTGVPGPRGRLDGRIGITTPFTDRRRLPETRSVRSGFLRQESVSAGRSAMAAGSGHEDFPVGLTPVAMEPAERYATPAS